MKAIVLQKDLVKVLSYTSRFVSTRAQLPILANIVLVANGNKLLIKATNLEISIAAPVGASVEEEGEIAVPAKIFFELIHSLRTEKITLFTEGDILNVESESFKGHISSLNTSDFPEVPVSVEKGISLSGDVFAKAIGKVLFSSSPDDTRPALSGVLMFSKDSLLSFVSSDGFRLSKKDIPFNTKEEVRIILPKNILIELQKIVSTEEVNIKVEEQDKQILFGVGDMVLSSRLIEGEYPPFEKIIPATSSITVNIEKEDFRDVVKTASVFARDGANIIKIHLDEGSVKVSAESARSGSQEGSAQAKITGPSIDVLFNYRYIEEFINIVEGESVEMKFNGPDSSGLFLDSSDKNYLHLIMPVKS